MLCVSVLFYYFFFLSLNLGFSSRVIITALFQRKVTKCVSALKREKERERERERERDGGQSQ
jgi:hypothetical protein